MSRIRHYSVGANLFAQKPNGPIYRANKFAPTYHDSARNQADLMNHELAELAAKIQVNYEELGI